MSESDYESQEEEYLMASRERRSNAGNKMKKLLAQEVEEMQSKTESFNDDELDLLFKEDAEDEDFQSTDSGEAVEDQAEQEQPSQVEEDNDLLVSESEEEVSEQDDESNENELQRQESLQRKRKKKSKPPIIKRKATKTVGDTSPVEAVKKKANYEVLKAESLLVSDRRTSKRSHVVANKLEVYEKLSLAEEKRKIIQERLKKHKEKQSEKVLTQEDRLRMSLETEKLNLQSLDKYKEQEISKKQTRLAIQQRQKMKFKQGEPIITELTTSWIVTPVMEREDKLYWDEQLRKREKKRKKYPRRQTKKKSPGRKDINAETHQSNEGVGNKKDGEMAEAPNNDDLRNSAIKGAGAMDQNAVMSQSRDQSQDIEVQDKNTDFANAPSNSTHEAKTESTSTKPATSEHELSAAQAKEMQPSLTEPPEIKVQESGNSEEINPSPSQPKLNTTSQHNETEIPAQNTVESSQDGIKSLVDQTPVNAQPEKSKDASEVEKQTDAVDKAHVTFADTPTPTGLQSADASKNEQVNNVATPELTDDNGTEDELILEGPPQEVSRNFVTIHNFGLESCNVDFRASLFGTQWQASQNQRSMNVENICKITMPENSNESSDKSPVVPDLSFLTNFPVFGEYGKRAVYDVGLNVGKEIDIEIKTLPPSGVLFSNGVRKKCFISSKECQYFDPKNGAPYSDVEAYKIIQELQNPLGDGSEDAPNPHFQWFGFKNGGVYLDVLQRPANGVPEGF